MTLEWSGAPTEHVIWSNEAALNDGAITAVGDGVTFNNITNKATHGIIILEDIDWATTPDETTPYLLIGASMSPDGTMFTDDCVADLVDQSQNLITRVPVQKSTTTNDTIASFPFSLLPLHYKFQLSNSSGEQLQANWDGSLWYWKLTDV